MVSFQRGSKPGFHLCGLFATAIMIQCNNSASAQQAFSTTLLDKERNIGPIELTLKTGRSFSLGCTAESAYSTESKTTPAQPPVIRPVLLGAAAKVITQSLFLLSLPEDPNTSNIGLLNYLLFFADPVLVAEGVHTGNRRLGHIESVYFASFGSLIFGGTLILGLHRELGGDEVASAAAGIILTNILQLALTVRTERRTALRRM